MWISRDKWNNQISKLDVWRNRAMNARANAVESEAKVAALTAQLESAVREREVMDRLTARLAEQNTAMMTRVDNLLREVLTLASRPPQIVDQTTMIREIGDVLSNILVGRESVVQDASGQPINYSPGTGMNDLGLANDYGTPPGFVPLHEIDPLIESEYAQPKVGEWTAHTPMTPSEASDPTYTTDAIGRVVRTDGMPMFQSGSSGLPPVGGVE